MPLCQSSCLNYISSIGTLFTNPAICPASQPEPILANRTSFLTPGLDQATSDVFYAYCTTLMSNDTAVCSPGLKSEAANLGFAATGPAAFSATLNAALACAASGQTLDPQCPQFYSNFQIFVVGFLNPISSTPWIASGIAQAFMLMIYLLFIAGVSIKRWSRATTIAHQPPAAAASNSMADGMEQGYTGTIARGTAKTIRRSQILRDGAGGLTGGPKYAPPTRQRESMFSRMSFMPKSKQQSRGVPRDSLFDSQRAPNEDAPMPLLVRMKCVEAYPAQLSDELELRKGDIIVIEEMFDDGGFESKGGWGTEERGQCEGEFDVWKVIEGGFKDEDV
ncbi:hypothetical protein HK101_010796 [Irineochytrium annulatum]|nr:hypothetical protein HK101_010796 [Irineochytrium annulatum]